jgi:hypothetical protein
VKEEIIDFMIGIIFFLFQKRARLLVRNVPDSNEMWSHNFGKGQAVLDF